MARLTARARKALPASSFALPGRKYPVDTENRARNALSRGAQNASPSQLAAIRRKVHRRYPSIRIRARQHAARVMRGGA